MYKCVCVLRGYWGRSQVDGDEEEAVCICVYLHVY